MSKRRYLTEITLGTPDTWHAVVDKGSRKILVMFRSLDDVNNWLYGEGTPGRMPYVDDASDYEVIEVRA